MMYLNSNVRPGPHLKSLLSHEYTHAISFSERLALPCGEDLPDEEDWLNEAIAHCAENLCDAGWSNVDYRVSRFLTNTSASPLVIPDYYRAGLWRDHGCRGATFLFLRWCVDQFGDELLPALMRNTNNGIANLAESTGHSFDELFRQWSLALIAPRANIAAAHNTYRTVNPYGRLASWGLIGPRTIPCPLGSDAKTIELKGTSTAYLELTCKETGLRRVNLQGEPESRLQVTLIKSSQSRAIEATAGWIADSTGATAPADAQIEIQLDGIQGANDAIEMIACEWNSGFEKQSYCFSANELQAAETAHSHSKDARRAYRLPIPNARDFEQELVVKVLGRTGEGRRMVAWTSLPAPRAAAVHARVEAQKATR